MPGNKCLADLPQQQQLINTNKNECLKMGLDQSYCECIGLVSGTRQFSELTNLSTSFDKSLGEKYYQTKIKEIGLNALKSAKVFCEALEEMPKMPKQSVDCSTPTQRFDNIECLRIATESEYLPQRQAAQVRLAQIYSEGIGVELDHQKAFYWYKKVAQSDGSLSAPSQRILGTLYLNGEGVEEDHNKAFYWVKKAVDNGGSGRAMSLLGNFHRLGVGTDVNMEKAIKWQKKAATSSDDDSEFAPRCYYFLGSTLLTPGPTMNKIGAYKWLLKAAKGGDVDAQNKLDKLCKESPWACQ